MGRNSNSLVVCDWISHVLIVVHGISYDKQSIIFSICKLL